MTRRGFLRSTGVWLLSAGAAWAKRPVRPGAKPVMSVDGGVGLLLTYQVARP